MPLAISTLGQIFRVVIIELFQNWIGPFLMMFGYVNMRIEGAKLYQGLHLTIILFLALLLIIQGQLELFFVFRRCDSLTRVL